MRRWHVQFTIRGAHSAADGTPLAALAHRVDGTARTVRDGVAEVRIPVAAPSPGYARSAARERLADALAGDARTTGWTVRPGAVTTLDAAR